MPTVVRGAATVDYQAAGSGPGLVLVHGTGANADTNWALVRERLERRWTVVRPNYAGSGATRDDGAPLTVAGLADQVLAAAEAAGAVPFDLLGFSLGAAVALKLAAEHPDKVRRLVLLGGFAGSADARLQLEFHLWRALIERGDHDTLARLVLLSGFSPAYISRLDDATVAATVAEIVATTDWPGMARQVALDLTLELGAEAGRIRNPTLVIGCTLDHMVPPAHAQALAARIPGATYASLASGHLAPVEQPDELLDLVEPFLLG